MDKESLKKYVIVEAKKVLAECDDGGLDEGLGGLFKSAEEKAKKWATDIVATANKSGKKVGLQWVTNYIRNTFKIKSGEIPKVLRGITPLYKTQDASDEYSIKQALQNKGVSRVAAQESIELTEGVTPEQIEKLVSEIKKINKKVDLRDPLLTENSKSIVDSIIKEDKKEIIKEENEVGRWKNLTDYKKYSDK